MRIIGGLCLCLVAGVASAQAPAPAGPADPFVGSAALGYLSTSGNTETTNGNGSFKVDWDLDGPWTHTWTALAITARTSDVTTAKAYAAGYKGARDINERSYLFAAGDWRQDRFSGFDRQATETVGYGNKLFETQRQVFSIEGGAGAKQSDLTDGTEFDEAIVRGALDYLLRISENAEFNQRLLLEQGDENRYTESTSALKARIVGNVALVLSFVIKSNSDVPVGVQNTDRFTAISVEYAF
jgi:putative salt-induced outer membrane protein